MASVVDNNFYTLPRKILKIAVRMQIIVCFFRLSNSNSHRYITKMTDCQGIYCMGMFECIYIKRELIKAFDTVAKFYFITYIQCANFIFSLIIFTTINCKKKP